MDHFPIQYPESIEEDIKTFLWNWSNLLITIRSFEVWEVDEENAISAIAWALFEEWVDEEEYYILKKYFNIEKAPYIFEQIVLTLWLSPKTWRELFLRLERTIKIYQIYEHIHNEGSFTKNYRTLLSCNNYWDIVVSRDWERIYLIQNWEIHTYDDFFSSNAQENQYFLFYTDEWNICYQKATNTVFEIEWEVWRAIIWEWWGAIINTTDKYEILSILNTWDVIKKRKILKDDTTTFLGVYSRKNGEILVHHAVLEKEAVLKHEKIKQEKKKSNDISDYDFRTYVYERLTNSETWKTVYSTRWHISHLIDTWKETFVIEQNKIYDSDFRSGTAEITQIVDIDEDESAWDFLTDIKHIIYQGSNTAIIIFYHEDSIELYDIKSGVTYWEIQDLVVEQHPAVKWEYFFSFIDWNKRSVKLSTIFSTLEIEFDEEGLPLGVVDTKGWAH